MLRVFPSLSGFFIFRRCSGAGQPGGSGWELGAEGSRVVAAPALAPACEGQFGSSLSCRLCRPGNFGCGGAQVRASRDQNKGTTGALARVMFTAGVS